MWPDVRQVIDRDAEDAEEGLRDVPACSSPIAMPGCR